MRDEVSAVKEDGLRLLRLQHTPCPPPPKRNPVPDSNPRACQGRGPPAASHRHLPAGPKRGPSHGASVRGKSPQAQQPRTALGQVLAGIVPVATASSSPSIQVTTASAAPHLGVWGQHAGASFSAWMGVKDGARAMLAGSAITPQQPDNLTCLVAPFLLSGAQPCPGTTSTTLVPGSGRGRHTWPRLALICSAGRGITALPSGG